MAKKSTVSENALQKAIVQYLRVNGFYAFSIYNGASTVISRGMLRFKRNPPDRPRGIPDICAMKDGKVLFFEVKTKTGRLSVDQALVHSEMLRKGVKVYIVRSIDDVKAAVSEVQRLQNL